MRENHPNAARWALGPAGLAVALAAGISLIGGPAQAQGPGDGIYDAPTPTPTATGTPFQNPNPTPPSGPKFMDPFPVIRTAGSFSGRRTTFTRFTVKGASGTKVAASCVKAKCKLRRTLKSRKTVHLRPLERTFKAGTRIRLRLTAVGFIGKYVEIRTRRNKRPLRRDLCLRPGRTRPVACEGG